MTKIGGSEVLYISTIAEVNSNLQTPGLEGSHGIRIKTPTSVDERLVKRALELAESNMSSLLDTITHSDNGKTFQLDQVEVTVGITQEGKARLFIGEIGGSFSTGFKLVWKRKQHHTK